MHGVSAVFFLLALTQAAIIVKASIWDNSGGNFGIGMLGCNADSNHQIPGYPDYFAGRQGIVLNAQGQREPAPGDGTCNWTDMRLILGKMDWSTRQLEYVTTLLDANTGTNNGVPNSFPKTPIQGGKFVIQSAYDPNVMSYNGELWVSFECWGQGMSHVSSCVGPMSAPGEGATIDLSRTTVVIEGIATSNGAGYAASVPKIFVHNGSPYLYYDAFLTGPGNLSQRGVPLELANNKLWVKGAGGNTYSILDPQGLTVDVWEPNLGDSTANNIIDVYQVVVDGAFVFATAGIGGCAGGTCSAPNDDGNKVGCYRAALGRSNFPLGPFDYVLNNLNSTALPSNSQEYVKVLQDPTNNNAASLYGQFLGTRPSPGYSLPSSYQAIPVPLDGNNVFFDGIGTCAAGYGERAGECVPSCGGLGGVASYIDPCYNHGRSDVGKAWDTPFCCGAEITCGDASHPKPDWGVKNGVCLRSCGGVGGTVGSTSHCAMQNKLIAGKSYDAPYCCKSTPCPQAF